MWKHNVKSLKYHFSNILVRCTEIKPMKIRYRTLMSIGSAIDVHPNIRNKILSGNPVVALESTIITHGMPYPQNLETAIKVEEIVKSEGSTPATIAVINGRIKIGLEKHHLEQLALDKNNTNVIKCSTRDLLYAVSKGISGGTTVAATLFVANKLGIKVFATGGIGGVHRDGQNTFDISADLIELGKSPMAVICSGVKSILDIQKTLEFLETHGVCVATYQVPDFEFPAFYTRKSGCKAPYNMENSEEAAEFIHSLLKIESKSGILLAVPIPEKDSIAGDLINNAIKNALNKCKENKIFGKNITPFVLQAVANITEGKSLEANISLIQNNARVASQIAVKLHKLLPSANGKSSIFVKETPFECSTHRISSKSYLKNQIRESGGVDRIEDIDDNSKIPIVIGASVIDINIKVQDDFKEKERKVGGKNK
ncbi:pseudouridine-5'-phosphate glycosidase-like isoform X1 [Condylostylus longicornis]|uniref:pseudouridine-5'-phosphate glycosidase-like isoform X1 n=1 Tax=Condylostylus longicornis TaxID=2530218 RepID=UPI00244DED00|nr:pseudouridine-5'-phosphate glycosidase-like isoform X1 [Condylostylus longicornis]XP_055388246.1 pseudouridine-5'-phosphate glycosidase-like isoform X1 [Condylostylus longicornis]XP_055388247.1 pseudouridine-5'-phosphate glycosidase-like isoform X1 [Condylostylus longicornis]